MNGEVSLTAEEFKRVHNAICDLGSVVRQLADLDNHPLHAKLVQVQKDLSSALASAYDQDDYIFQTKTKHFDTVKQQLSIQDSEWSIYEVNDLYERHPFHCAQWVVYENHNGKGPVKAPIKGETWAGLWLAADRCIRLSGDQHHVYIEQFKQNTELSDDTLFLHTGS
jgi:hypothetical protein